MLEMIDCSTAYYWVTLYQTWLAMLALLPHKIIVHHVVVSFVVGVGDAHVGPAQMATTSTLQEGNMSSI